MNRRAFITTASTAVTAFTFPAVLRAQTKEFGIAPGDYSTYSYSGVMEIISKVPANEEQDRTCAEKGHA